MASEDLYTARIIIWTLVLLIHKKNCDIIGYIDYLIERKSPNLLYISRLKSWKSGSLFLSRKPSTEYLRGKCKINQYKAWHRKGNYFNWLTEWVSGWSTHWTVLHSWLISPRYRWLTQNANLNLDHYLNSMAWTTCFRRLIRYLKDKNIHSGLAFLQLLHRTGNGVEGKVEQDMARLHFYAKCKNTEAISTKMGGGSKLHFSHKI